MNNFKIRWHKTGNNQWTANPQIRNGVTYSAVINFAANVYTVTVNPGAIATPFNTLRSAKNQFRKYLLNK